MAKKKPQQQLPAKGGGMGGGRFDRIVTIGIVVALLVIGLILWGPLKKYQIKGGKDVQQAQKKQAAPEHADRKPGKTEKTIKTDSKERIETKEPRKREASLQGSERKVLVAIVIDDLGQDLKPAREIGALPANITFAVMPGLPQSRKVAEFAKQTNREVLLHLPMEYRGRNGRPSPGMLRSDMTPMDFLSVLTDDLASVPGAVGVNNHEGSLLTENKEAMKFLMAELKARDLLFLDSLTTSKSLAFTTAKEFGLRTTRRDVFLDNDSTNAESIRKQLDELARVAREHGRAIGIGHPHPATISELRQWLAGASRQGIEVVPVSRIIQ